MKRLLSLFVVLAMVISMVPCVFAADDEIDMDELLGKLEFLDSIDEISVSLVAAVSDKIYRWTPEDDGVLGLAFELPEGVGADVTIAQDNQSITYSQCEGAFELEVKGGTHVDIMVSKTSEVALEFTMYGTFAEPYGSENNPYVLTELVNEIELENAPAWFLANFNGAQMTVTGTGAYSVLVNGEPTAAVEGVVTMEVVTADPRMPFAFVIDQAGAYTIEFAYPAGSQMNPVALVLGENTAEIEAGSQGYYYTWTAEAAGDLTITMPEGNWTYVVNNLTSGVYGDTQWSDSEPVQASTTITVAAGDEIQIIVNTYNPEDEFNAPAGTLVFTAEFVMAVGTEQNPIMVELVWNEDYTEATATVTAPVGTTYYAAYNVGGMLLSINGGEANLLQGMPRAPVVFAITNDGEAEAEYTLTFTYPAGSQMNPAELLIGENTAEIAAGSQGYYYTWTAEEAGELTITMPEGNWTYVVNNLTSGVYGDTQWSDSEPLQASTTIAVAVGDEIQVIVNTYDPEDEYNAPAGTLVFTAAFNLPAPEYVPGDLDGDNEISEEDAIFLLQHILMPDLFEANQPVDYDRDGEVNEDDAIYLLQHLLMPELFPIA